MDIIPGLTDVPVAYTKIYLLDGKMESLYTKDIKLHSRLKFRIIDFMKNFLEKAHLIEILQSVIQ
jgi:citrate synthase